MSSPDVSTKALSDEAVGVDGMLSSGVGVDMGGGEGDRQSGPPRGIPLFYDNAHPR